MILAAAAPTFLGYDIYTAGTILLAIATMTAILAFYGAVKMKDPMAKRVKGLVERREQLKAGITASTSKKRAKLVRNTNTTDQMRAWLGSMKVLQEEQVKDVQQKLAQAGIRRKELAVLIIFGRLVGPLLIGGGVGVWIYGFGGLPDYSTMKKFGVFAAATIFGYKAGDIYLQNLITKRTDAIRKGLPDALDLLVICAEAGLTVDAAFNRVAKELGRGYPELGDEFALTAIELGFLTERRMAFENLAYLDPGRGDHDDPDREIWHAARLCTARAVGGIPQRTHDARRRKGGTTAGNHDRAVDSVHSADAVYRYSWPGSLLDQRRILALKGRSRLMLRPPLAQSRQRSGGGVHPPSKYGRCRPVS
jgi:tight adherence protein C